MPGDYMKYIKILTRAKTDGPGIVDGDVNGAGEIPYRVTASGGLVVNNWGFLPKSELSSYLI